MQQNQWGISRKWLVFFAVGLGTFVSVVDNGSINLALPSISSHFKTNLSAVQWVTLGQALAISVFLLPAGHIADKYGRKEIYVIGLIIFAIGAGLAGFATDLWVVIGLRIISAFGSAMIIANGMAILTTVFPATERGKAVGSYMSIIGTGSICGPLLGGAIVNIWGWRGVFFLNPILGFFAIASAVLVLDRQQLAAKIQSHEKANFDWAGAILSATTLLVFLLTITNGNRLGWSSSLIVTGFIVTTGSLGLFLRREMTAESPMLDLSLFRNRIFSMGLLAGFIAFLNASSNWLLLPFYLQRVLAITPLKAGFVMVSWAACFALMGSMAGRLSDRFGWRPFNIGGSILMIAGVATISQITESSSLTLVVSGLILLGLGNGIFHTTNHSSILGSIEPSRYGIASAFINLNRQTASTTGLALAMAIVVGTMGSMGVEPNLDLISEETTKAGHAFTVGLRHVYTLASGLMVAVLAISILKGDGR